MSIHLEPKKVAKGGRSVGSITGAPPRQTFFRGRGARQAETAGQIFLFVHGVELRPESFPHRQGVFKKGAKVTFSPGRVLARRGQPVVRRRRP